MDGSTKSLVQKNGPSQGVRNVETVAKCLWILFRITNGTFSDYFMTGCRTSENGLSMLLIPRSDEVDTKPIKTAYSGSAGTAYVTFDRALVPAENLLGEENEGLKVCKKSISFIILQFLFCHLLGHTLQF